MACVISGRQVAAAGSARLCPQQRSTDMSLEVLEINTLKKGVVERFLWVYVIGRE
jgi:hypothetical protein